jgi:hypothetical protein
MSFNAWGAEEIMSRDLPPGKLYGRWLRILFRNMYQFADKKQKRRTEVRLLVEKPE